MLWLYRLAMHHPLLNCRSSPKYAPACLWPTHLVPHLSVPLHAKPQGPAAAVGQVFVAAGEHPSYGLLFDMQATFCWTAAAL